MTESDPYKISSIEELRQHYDMPSPLIVRSKFDFIHDYMIQYMKLAPIVCVASETEAGLDASPRGGEPGFVKALDRKTVAFADWPGGKAFRRSHLWKPEDWPDVRGFPTVGKVLADMAKITELSVDQLNAFYEHGLTHELY